MLRSRCRSLHSCAAQYRRRGPSPGEGLVRVVRLMLAHGRVVVTMRHGRQEATQCPLRTGSWCADPVKGKLTAQVNLAVVVIVMTRCARALAMVSASRSAASQAAGPQADGRPLQG